VRRSSGDGDGFTISFWADGSIHHYRIKVVAGEYVVKGTAYQTLDSVIAAYQFNALWVHPLPYPSAPSHTSVTAMPPVCTTGTRAPALFLRSASSFPSHMHIYLCPPRFTRAHDTYTHTHTNISPQRNATRHTAPQHNRTAPRRTAQHHKHNKTLHSITNHYNSQPHSTQRNICSIMQQNSKTQKNTLNSITHCTVPHRTALGCTTAPHRKHHHTTQHTYTQQHGI